LRYIQPFVHCGQGRPMMLAVTANARRGGREQSSRAPKNLSPSPKRFAFGSFGGLSAVGKTGLARGRL
jgi:hypothetical protein